MTRVFPGPGAPEFVAREVIPLIQLFAHLVPTWCHEIEVGYRSGKSDDDDNDTAYTLAIDASVPYRRAELRVGAQWFERDDEWRARTIIHEIGHLYVGELHGIAEHLAEQLAAEGTPHRATLDRALADAEEAAVEDFADLVWRLTRPDPVPV